MLSQVFKLVNLENQWGEVQGQDFLCAIRTATFASGTIDIDLTGVVRKGATVYYAHLKEATTNATTGKATCTAAVAGDVEVFVMIFFRPVDIAPSSEVTLG